MSLNKFGFASVGVPFALPSISFYCFDAKMTDPKAYDDMSKGEREESDAKDTVREKLEQAGVPLVCR